MCFNKGVCNLKSLCFFERRITLQYNERFGATAAVTPLKAMCEYERKYPAERLVEAAADAKPPAVVCHSGTETND